ncbi:MAG: hypothetical protein LBU51_02375 [Bacteroidales bacterium]|jgi:hypothetical protein|nr:hypothetical protein [Bacteroidales bacterium]
MLKRILVLSLCFVALLAIFSREDKSSKFKPKVPITTVNSEYSESKVEASQPEKLKDLGHSVLDTMRIDTRTNLIRFPKPTFHFTVKNKTCFYNKKIHNYEEQWFVSKDTLEEGVEGTFTEIGENYGFATFLETKEHNKILVLIDHLLIYQTRGCGYEGGNHGGESKHTFIIDL